MIIEILGDTSELYTWKSTENTKKELMTTVEEMVNILLKKKKRIRRNDNFLHKVHTIKTAVLK